MKTEISRFVIKVTDFVCIAALVIFTIIGALTGYTIHPILIPVGAVIGFAIVACMSAMWFVLSAIHSELVKLNSKDT